MTQRSKRWTWTLNNWSETELSDVLENLIFTYIIVGKEMGENSTPHLQGYFETASNITLNSLKKHIPRAHLEKARGSQTDNYKYCTKDGDFIEQGTPMKQGNRSDLDEVVEAIRSGDTLRNLWQNHSKTMIRHHKGISIAYQKLSPNVGKTLSIHPIESFSWNPTINWEKTQIFWGVPGVGKTCFALALIPTALMVSHMDDLLNYDEQIHGGIVFDDMSLSHHPRTSQIHLVDQDFPRSIHCRYSTATIPAQTKKIFTTNETEGQCLDINDGAIRRRVSIIKLTKL